MKLIRMVAALIALLVAGAVHADDVTLSWTHDGKNTDGSAATLAGFRIHYGITARNSTIDVPSGTARTYIVPALGAGTWQFDVVAYDTRGFESLPSEVATRDVAEPPPSPLPSAPGTLTTTAVRSAYTIKQTDNRISVVAVGTVPAGQLCVATNGVFVSGKVYFRVPVTSVTWSGSVRPVVVVADCT